VVIPDLRPGDIVIMENLGSHKGPGVQAAIEAADADCALFHALQPELQPHREGLLRTQGPSPQKSQNVTRYLVRQDQHTDRSDLT